MDSGSLDDFFDSILDGFSDVTGSIGDSIGGGMGSITDLLGPFLDGLAIASGGEPAEIEL